jgi:hypothetical protein
MCLAPSFARCSCSVLSIYSRFRSLPSATALCFSLHSILCTLLCSLRRSLLSIFFRAIAKIFLRPVRHIKDVWTLPMVSHVSHYSYQRRSLMQNIGSFASGRIVGMRRKCETFARIDTGGKEQVRVCEAAEGTSYSLS